MGHGRRGKMGHGRRAKGLLTSDREYSLDQCGIGDGSACISAVVGRWRLVPATVVGNSATGATYQRPACCGTSW